MSIWVSAGLLASILCWQRAPFIIGGEDSPLGEATADAGAQGSELADEEAALSLDGVMKASAWADGGKFGWSVYFDRERLLAHLQIAGFQAGATDDARLLAWYRATAAEICERSLRSNAAVRGSSASTERDISISFAEGRLDEHFYCTVCNFKGTRLIYCGDPLAAADPLKQGGEGPRLNASIRLRSAEFDELETICGTVVWSNSGSGVARVGRLEFSQPQVQTADGQEPEPIPAKFTPCSLATGPNSTVEIAPGAAHEITFSIETDPLGTYGGWVLKPGSYQVVLGDPSSRFGVPTRVGNALFAVRASAQPHLARIVAFFVTRDRLVTCDENGAIESRPLMGDGPLYRANLARYQPVASWSCAEVCAPSGTLVASGVHDHPQGRPVAIDILNLKTGESTPLKLPTVEGPGESVWYPLAFWADEKRLSVSKYGFQDSTVYEIELSDGAHAAPIRCDSRYWSLSPDRRHIVRWCAPNWVLPDANGGYAIQIEDRDGKWSGEIRLPGRDLVHFQHVAGVHGIYVRWAPQREGEHDAGDGSNGDLKCYDYSGKELCRFPGKYSLRDESERAPLVALDSASFGVEETNAISVWRLGGREPLWSLPTDGHYELQFDGAGEYALVGRRSSGMFSFSVTYSRSYEVRKAESGELVRTIFIE